MGGSRRKFRGNARAAGVLAVLLWGLLFWAGTFAPGAAGAGAAPAGPILAPRPEPGHYDLTPYLSAWTTPGGWAPGREAVPPGPEAEFRPLVRPLVRVRPGQVLWLRCTLAPQAGPPDRGEPRLLEVDTATVDQVALYLPDPAAPGGWRVLRSGAVSPLAQGQLVHRAQVFPLPPAPGGEATFYLRLAGHAARTVPLSLWSPEAFRQANQADSLAYGLLFGVILAMTSYNFFLFLSLRDPLYMRYVVYIGNILVYLFMFNGFHRVLISPADLNVYRWLGFLVGSLVFTATSFAKAFLGTRSATPRLHWMLTAAQALGVMIGALALAEYYYWANHLAQVAGVLGPLTGLAAGAVRWRQGFRPARYFLLAWTMLLLGVVYFVLKDLGVVDWRLSGGLGMTLGAALESVLLSFALGDHIRRLRREKEALARSKAHYQQASLTDGLTGLYNLRYFHRRLADEVNQARETGRPLSLLVLDVDGFKGFNDTYGHPAGDLVLNRLAALLRRSARESDAACRHGGDEMALILPGADLASAVAVAERLRQEFAALVLPVGSGEAVRAAISVGAAQWAPGEDAAGLVQRADRALYAAKEQGRNRVAPAA
ncbi:MAG: sensor domain-containing diguanylate cyclase [Deltaproteobacteria bacterium]|nr:sensor domain-containing diguanylate cyclase [Deltaproteobacteria bacterium]